MFEWWEYQNTPRVRLFGRLVRWDTPTRDDREDPFCITRGAITEEMLEDERIAFRINHEQDLCTLKDGAFELRADDRGIWWEFETLENRGTTALLKAVKDGRLAGLSISIQGGSFRTVEMDGRQVRRYHRVGRVRDVSLVDVPAIPGCFVRGVRLRPACLQEKRPAARRPKATIRRKPARPIQFTETRGMRRGRMLAKMMAENGEPLARGGRLFGDVSLLRKIDARIRQEDPGWTGSR